MSCKDCLCSTCLDTRRDAMEDALHTFLNSGWDLVEFWDEAIVESYPTYLPSFDEFLNRFAYILEVVGMETLESDKDQSLRNVEYAKLVIEKRRLVGERGKKR